MNSINDYPPYKEIIAQIKEYSDKRLEIEAEVKNLQQAPTQPHDLTGQSVTELLANSGKQTANYIPTLQSQLVTLKTALIGLETKRREVINDFSVLVTELHQGEFDAINKQMAAGFLALQTALLKRCALESDIYRSGAEIRGPSNQLHFPIQAIEPDSFNSFQREFYQHAININAIARKDIPKALTDLLNI